MFIASLKIQPRLACGIGQRLDAAVIEIAAAIEDYVLDALLLGALGDQLADRLGRSDTRAGLQIAQRILLKRRSGSERGALIVVDQLRVDVLGGAEHGQPR